MEISDDEDEAMAWSPGRKHKVVTLSCTQYSCSHLMSSSHHRPPVRQRTNRKATGHQARRNCACIHA